MRTLPNALIVVLVPVAEFVVIRHFGINGAIGFFLIFVTMAFLMVWAVKQDSRASELKVQNGVASFGFLPADRDDVALSIYPLRGNGGVEGAAWGQLRGLQTWIFDYCIYNPGAPNNSINQTVVAFEVEDADLPTFQIRPLNRSTSIYDRDWRSFDGNWENSEDTICFPDAAQFHKCFELNAVGEEGVRRHFNAKLLDTIAALNDCNYWVKGDNTNVLFFTPNKILPPEEYEAFARKSADIAYAIFSADKLVKAAAAK